VNVRAVVAVMTLAGGCRTAGGALRVTGISSAVMVAGMAGFAATCTGDCHAPDRALPFAGMALGGLAMAGAAALNFAVLAIAGDPWNPEVRARRAEAEAARVEAEREREATARRVEEDNARLRGQERRAKANETYKAAATSARSGACDAVAQADVQIRALDGEFADAVFVRDAAIARCLGR
jgi:hypothetical protein